MGLQMLSKFIMRPDTAQEITVAGTSATHTNAFGSQTHVVRLSGTTALRYAVGAPASVAATATSTYLPAGVIEYIQVRPGEKVAAIQESAGGKLSVTEMTS